MIRTIATCICALWVSTASAQVVVQEFETPNGTDVWLVEEHSIPFVALEILIDGGSALDLPGKRGATNMMMGLLEEGAGDLNAQEFQQQREALAASFGFRTFDDSVKISAQFLTENRDEAIALLASALNEPRFDEDAIERVRGQILTGIRGDAKRPNAIAGDAFYAAAFGDHHYGSDQSGTIETVTGLKRDDLIEAHRNALVGSRVYVSVVGDITQDEVGNLIDTLLAGLPQDGPDLPGRVEFGLDGGITVIPFETPQSVAIFGHSGMKRDDEDFFAAYIMNTILGGTGPQSILMEEVREKRGLTYGVYTYLIPKDHTELVLGSVASSNESIAEAIEVIRSEWDRLSTEGFSQEQLDIAKTYLTGEYPLRFDGNGEIADILLGMQAIGLPAEYVFERNDYINAVTLEDLNRVAAELLRPDDLHFVVVGEPEGLETAE
jgi:zinc protease